MSRTIAGRLPAPGYRLDYSLASGQVFRWGRDRDGWWKGIACGTAFHLRQDGANLEYRASAEFVDALPGRMRTPEFLGWYLRLGEPARLRVPKGDAPLRDAKRALRGFRFVRQEPFECLLSYVLSVQAHMALTRSRIELLARRFGRPVGFEGERYWSFPGPRDLAGLTASELRARRFGYRSEKVVASARIAARHLEASGAGRPDLGDWRRIADDLRATPGSGVGLKVAKCIDLFALDRLGSFAVDTWVRRMAREWYGIEGADARICEWGEKRYGARAGYAGEYLFAWYREQRATAISDRVVTFCASGEPSERLPFEQIGRASRGMSHESRITSHESRVTGHESRATGRSRAIQDE